MAPPVRPMLPCLDATESERPPPALTSDLLEDIFLRLGCFADLARASIGCVSFRRLVTDPSFLRRYRSLHPPLLLGFIDPDGIDPVKAPHPNAPATRALARVADFSFSYLPRDAGLCDARDGRILFEFIDEDEEYCFLWDLGVCDPLSRRCLLLPSIPDHLLASVDVQARNIADFQTFLVPSGDVDDTSFRVIRCTFGVKRLVVFVFSSCSGCWNIGASTTWDALSLDEPKGLGTQNSRDYVYGCFYWKVDHWNKLLKFSINSMEFSTIDLPSDHVERNVAIVEAGEGMLAMFSQIRGGTSLDYYTFVQNGSEKASEWHMKNTIPLPAHYDCSIGHQAEGHIFLLGLPKVRGTVPTARFLLQIKTFNVEKVCRMRNLFANPYFGYPPFLLPRRTQDMNCFRSRFASRSGASSVPWC